MGRGRAPRGGAVDTGVGTARVDVDPRGRAVRRLLIDEEVHGAVDLDDPTNLVVDYQDRLVRLLLALGPPDGDVIHLGGGAAAIPRALAAHLRARSGGGTSAAGSSAGAGGGDGSGRDHPVQLVVERSAAIIALARRELRLDQQPDLRVVKGEARKVLGRQQPDSAGAIVVDVFVGQRTPDHLSTTEFHAELRRVLAPQGVAVLNLVDEAPWSVTATHAAAARQHFDLVFGVGARGVARLRDPGNVLLVATGADVDLQELGHRLATGAHPSALIPPGRLAALPGRARSDADLGVGATVAGAPSARGDEHD